MVTSGNTTTKNFSLLGQSAISYAYDALGRLIGVTDSLGDTATYQYDAVGNLLSIGRYSSAQISIIGFAPTHGTAGSQVTIYGTAFSPTPSSNTVTFNGTSATVTSASTTQLVVTVPAGASTGAIGVTAPSGSTTSSSVYSIP
jgi:YD repeat-containing protein